MTMERRERAYRERIQFDFSPEALQKLDALKEKTGATTRAETIQNALRVYIWLVDEVDSESTIKILNENNEIVAVLKAKVLLR